MGTSPVTCEFPAHRPVTRSFGVFFDLRLIKRLSKQSWGWWFETLFCPLWRHYNESDPNCRFFSPCDLEILHMTLKNNRASLLCYLNCPWARSMKLVHRYHFRWQIPPYIFWKVKLYFLKKSGGHVKEVAKCQKFWTNSSYYPHHKMALNWRMFIPSSASFWTFLDILIMGLTSNLAEILISGVHRPHGLLITLHWISVISWPLIDHTLSAYFRTNLVEIFIRGCTDFTNFWSHFIEFPSYPGL